MKINKILTSLTAFLAIFVFAFVAYAASTTVTGNTSAGENQPGWLFNRDTSTSTPFEFTTDKFSIGTGSLYVKPIGATASDKFIAENFINTSIADINTITYDFMIGSGGTASDANEFYMNVYANFGVSDDDKFYDCRYNVVPTTGSLANFTTVSFDPSQSYSVATRGGASASPFTCPAVPADMDLLSTGSNIRVFSINVGDTSANDTGLDGYLDNVVVSTTSNVTTYDFEKAPVVTPTATPSATPTPTPGSNPTATPVPGNNSSSNTTSVTEPKKEVLGATTLGKTGSFEKNLANLFVMTAVALFALSGASVYVKRHN